MKLLNSKDIVKQAIGEVYEESVLNGKSQIATALRSFIKTGEETKDNILNFLRNKLITKLKKLTLKGVALAVGMSVGKNDKDITSDSIKSFVKEKRAKKDKPYLRNFSILATVKGVFIESSMEGLIQEFKDYKKIEDNNITYKN